MSVLIWSMNFSAAQASSLKDGIQISGLSRTQESVVMTEVSLAASRDPEVVKQKLLQTGLFSKVEVITDSDSNLKIILEEKWTTIPIAKFNSGGGSQQSILGVYDPNVFGRRLELGFQHERLSEAPSYVGWFKVPRLFGTSYFSDIQYWDTQRIRIKYDQSKNEPIVTKAFLLESKKTYLAFGKELPNDFKLRFSFEQYKDVFSEDLIPQETLNKVRGQTLPPKTETLLYGAQLDWGNLKIENHSQIGTTSSLQIRSAQVIDQSDKNFSTAKFELTHAQFVLPQWIYAQRIQLGYTDTSILQFWNYSGGLESIRGFVDNRFASRKYWLSNSELRRFIYEKPSWVLQGVAFADLLGIDEEPKKLENINAASLGGGLRLIMPKVYRLVLRLDVASPVINTDEQKVSFGIQQFF